MGGLVEAVTGLLGFNKPKINIPEPKVPAVPAPNRRTDTGAQVVVGSDAGQDTRVTGRKAGSGTSSVTDVLGGLGKSGLSI